MTETDSVSDVSLQDRFTKQLSSLWNLTKGKFNRIGQYSLQIVKEHVIVKKVRNCKKEDKNFSGDCEMFVSKEFCFRCFACIQSPTSR